MILQELKIFEGADQNAEASAVRKLHAAMDALSKGKGGAQVVTDARNNLTKIVGKKKSDMLYGIAQRDYKEAGKEV